MTKELDGMIAKLPSATRNMYVDGESRSLLVASVGHADPSGAKARTH